MSKDIEQKVAVFNIQRYSIHDGPGIRTTVFFKGCPLRCFWCQNPESQRMEPEVFLNKDNCTLCGRCVDVCPTAASTLSDVSSVIDRSKCTGCGKCVEACPNGARTLVGKYLALAEIMKEVLRDKKFYDNSGGGVTLGGGEPTTQPEMALSILRGCREVGLHTALDTCGYASWPVMEKLLEYTDLVLYDIKCMDAGKHNDATGISNEFILENAIKVAQIKPVRVRIPMISGFNDFPEEIKAIAHFVRTELGPVDIELLPYNKLGESKYERLDRPPVSFGETEEKIIQELEKIVGSCR